MTITVNTCIFCNRLNNRTIGHILRQSGLHDIVSTVNIVAGVISFEVEIAHKYGCLESAIFNVIRYRMFARTLADSIKILYKLGIVLD